MFKILVPVDFSEESEKACLYAFHIAANTEHAQLLLLHCFQDYLADADTDTLAPDQMTASEEITERVLYRNETEAQEMLEEQYRLLQREAGDQGKQVYIERAFIHGLPEDKIVEEATRYKPDLLIMGTKGEANIARSFFGTVSTKVVQELKVPVLTIPNAYQGNTLSKVAYATDFSKTDSRSIIQLQQLLQAYQPFIYCIHISDGAPDLKEQDKLSQLREKLQKNAIDQSIKYILLEGDDVAEALQKFVAQEGIDILALTTHERSMFGKILNPSLAQKLVLHANVPLLVFHDADQK
ncbi:universal stress protein [Pontibacter sp. MBLB2868]|uniref:universal stress protein n=1 Tax=Pontibacter sp. MBLB2868 TaxID=3451555 RepID=UPI003F74B506